MFVAATLHTTSPIGSSSFNAGIMTETKGMCNASVSFTSINSQAGSSRYFLRASSKGDPSAGEVQQQGKKIGEGKRDRPSCNFWIQF